MKTSHRHWLASILLLTIESSAWCQTLSPSQQVYEEVSLLRDQHSDVIWGNDPASKEQLQAILDDLDKGLVILASPLNHDLAEGNVFLKYRTVNFQIDKAKLLARMGDIEKGVAVLNDMARIDWVDPSLFGPPPDGDPDLKLLVTDPRADGLRNRYAVGPKFNKKSVLNSPYKAQLSVAERAAGLSRIWSTARAGFVWFDHVPDLDWDKLYLDTLPLAMATEDSADYYRILMRFTAMLKDGHSNAYPPQELAPKFYSRPGLRTARVEEKVLVTRISDAALAKRGLQVGDEIEQVDGLPVDQYVLLHVAPFVSSSTPQDRQVRSYTYSLLSGAKEQPVRLALRHANGDRFSLTAPRSGYTSEPGPANETFELRADGVAVLKAGQLEDNAAPKLLEKNIDLLMQAKAFVIDLRGNGGGSGRVGFTLLSWLQKGVIPTAVSQVRDDTPYSQAGSGPTAAPSWKSLPSDGFNLAQSKQFNGPVAILIDAATFSAAEDTATAFKLMKRGIIVGTPSGGSTGQPISFPLPGGGSARICVKRDSYPDGSDFVGVGVQPDILIAPTVAAVRSGSDPALQRAIDALLTPHS